MMTKSTSYPWDKGNWSLVFLVFGTDPSGLRISQTFTGQLTNETKGLEEVFWLYNILVRNEIWTLKQSDAENNKMQPGKKWKMAYDIRSGEKKHKYQLPVDTHHKYFRRFWALTIMMSNTNLHAM